MLMIDPLYVVSGFGVGLLVGMTGVGGGSLMTPLLILLFGIHPATAVGTDLLYAAATKTGGSVAHGWARSIHWPAVIRLASGSIPASILTLVVLWQLDLNAESSRSLVNLVLCFALLPHRGKPGIPQGHHGALSSGACSGSTPAALPARRCWWAQPLACWSRFLRSGPVRWASPRFCCFTPSCQ